MIQIEHLQKAINGRILFSDANLQVEDGEFIVILGESGSGKTTLINMVGALEPMDGGRILVDGIDVSVRKNKRQYLAEKVGFLFQNYALIQDKTVSENLSFIKEKNISGISMEKALELVGLEDKIDDKVYTLSGGEQQRVALARLIIKKCDIILADEPTGSLDSRNAAVVMQILKNINRLGKTVLIVSHDEEIKKQAQRVLELRNTVIMEHKEENEKEVK